MEWIKCSDKLPAIDYEEIIVFDSKIVSSGFFSSKTNKFYYFVGDFDYDYKYVTHWMPLPQPPEE